MIRISFGYAVQQKFARGLRVLRKRCLWGLKWKCGGKTQFKKLTTGNNVFIVSDII